MQNVKNGPCIFKCVDALDVSDASGVPRTKTYGNEEPPGQDVPAVNESKRTPLCLECLKLI